jgi:hypothetical protein
VAATGQGLPEQTGTVASLRAVKIQWSICITYRMLWGRDHHTNREAHLTGGAVSWTPGAQRGCTTWDRQTRLLSLAVRCSSCRDYATSRVRKNDAGGPCRLWATAVLTGDTFTKYQRLTSAADLYWLGCGYSTVAR